MKKLINFLVGAVIGVIVLYIISFVLACIVTVIIVIVNRVIAYRKKHRRFTDWVYKSNRQSTEEVGSQIQIKRVFYYERFDRVLNITETKEDVRITLLKGRTENERYAEELDEWFAFKKTEKVLIDQEVQRYYSTL